MSLLTMALRSIRREVFLSILGSCYTWSLGILLILISSSSSREVASFVERGCTFTLLALVDSK